MTKKLSEKNIITATELFDLNMSEVPKLLSPFLQKVGVAALVGSSDTGKSTLLRQFGLHIALKIKTFLNFRIKAEYHRVLYISTEDDPYTVSNAIRKQASKLKEEDPTIDLNLLENYVFSFSPDKPFETVKKQLEENKYDLVILDAFADIFSGEINANTQVRQFLNKFDNLAKKHECLMVFLHHIGKRTDRLKAHKDNIIGTQAFEAKMRSVLELRKNPNDPKQRDLWVLKANFLGDNQKNKSFVLSFDSSLIFNNTEDRGTGKKANTQTPKVLELVTEYYNEGLSDREIAKRLQETSYKLEKSSVNVITKKLRSKK
jgi:RecA-family ATPase